MTPNGIAIRALRETRKLGLRGLARLTGLDRSFLSRLERGLAGASEDTIRRIAQALEVSPADITRGDDVLTKDEKTSGEQEKPTREVPAPGTEAGAYFHYTPEEAQEWLPWSALQLRRKAYAREIPHNSGGSRVSFTGLDIREISRMTAVPPLAKTHKRTARTSAA